MKLTTRYLGGSLLFFVLFLTTEFYLLSGRYQSIYRKLINIRGTNQHYSKSSNINDDLSFGNITVSITAEQFQLISNIKTGNPLIDEYGSNDLNWLGENGKAVMTTEKEQLNISAILEKYRLNIVASDIVPLNRMVPDSRPPGCKTIKYSNDLPKTSIIIPFYDEWPSVLIRTVYSIINRTPRHLLQEIILVDDNSRLVELKSLLDKYIDKKFPRGLVKLIRNPTREGLIKARIKGWKQSTGEVVVFFDSHMEVNINWLQPLLTAVKKDRKTIAMGMLDYIDSKTLEYAHYPGYFTRYGFDWRLVFFETFFRPDQIGSNIEDPRPGVVMVGPAYAVDSKYFGEIGAYDEGMKIWGGENLEFPWRVWMCGGHLLHFPCSRLGHIARFQPYSFPGGRRHIEAYNYKRAMDVWMEPNHKKFVYDHYPEMENMDVGDLTERLQIKEKLQCKNFTWFLTNIWPELTIFDRDALAWGSIRNINHNKCLDNHEYLFQAEELLYIEICSHQLATQGFSWTKDLLLRTSLQCVVVKESTKGTKPKLEDCIIGPRDEWKHEKNGYLMHVKSGLCMNYDGFNLFMDKCDTTSRHQTWSFQHYHI